MKVIKPGSLILVTGVLTPESIAWQVAKDAVEAGARVIATYNPRHARHGKIAVEKIRIALGEKLTSEDQLCACGMDITQKESIRKALEDFSSVWGENYKFDGVVHCVAFAPMRAIGEDFISTGWEDVSKTLEISAYSLPMIISELGDRLKYGAGVVALTFDSQVAWSNYSWMGVAKAALESEIRYLAKQLGGQGIRVNAVSAGPIMTTAAKAIPDFPNLTEKWEKYAPIGWDSTNCKPVAQTVLVLLGDLLCATTGEIIYVDGGYHSQGL